jgi:mannose-1-phosphate guanylyltransferase/phosphomannomutase
MAGGEGTRLRPLTSNRPKPMVPVVGRPVMEHILALLRRHGIHQVIVTLQYLAEQIEDYFGDGSDFGMDIRYSIETEPLGTAGSVRRCAADLDGTFLVISGDALTDVDLTQAIETHRAREAWVTLALARVDNPREFGIVITDSRGAIQRFVEKPTWSEVFSDTINTGIYVLEPQALAEVPPDQPYDFSKDLFPRLLAARAPLYGCPVEGYWCDIGNLAQLMQANEDALRGRVRLDLPGRRLFGDVFVGSGVYIDPAARLRGPMVIGENSAVRGDALIEGPAVIGANSVIEHGCQLQRSVLFGNDHIGPRCTVQGALLGRGVRMGAGASVAEGAVIGDGSHLQEGCRVHAEVKLWPNKVVEPQAVVNQSIVWGSRGQRTLFGAAEVTGAANLDVTPEVALRLGAAYGSCLQRGDAVAVSRDGHPASVMMKRALMAGLVSAGLRVHNLEALPLPVVRYATSALGARGGVFVQMPPDQPGTLAIRVLDERGIDIDSNMERKIENLYFREDVRRVSPDDVGAITYPAKVLDIYLTGYLAALGVGPEGQPPRAVVDYGGGTSAQVLPQALAELGCQVVGLHAVDAGRRGRPVGGAGADGAPRKGDEDPEALQELAHTVRALRADCGVRLDASGERLTVIDDEGHALGHQRALVLFAFLATRHSRGAEVAVPITATAAVEAVCARNGATVRRTRSGSRALMNAAVAGGLTLAGDGRGGFAFPAFHPGIDGLFAAGLLLRWLRLEQRPLSALLAELPAPLVQAVEVPCPWQAKGLLMRRLVEATAGERVTLLDGIKLHQGDSWVAVLPDAHRPLVHLYAEPADGAGAALLEQYRAFIEGVVGEAVSAASLEPEEQTSP